jgi:hypothetical protein
VEWEKLVEMVLANFDKDRYQVLLRQLDALKQTSSMLEYHTEFEKMAHRILLYNLVIGGTILITRFISGLHEDIRSAISLHHRRMLIL